MGAAAIVLVDSRVAKWKETSGRCACKLTGSVSTEHSSYEYKDGDIVLGGVVTCDAVEACV